MLIAVIAAPCGAATVQPAMAPSGVLVLSPRTSAAASPEVSRLKPVIPLLGHFAAVSRCVVLLLNGSHELLTDGAVPVQALTW